MLDRIVPEAAEGERSLGLRLPQPEEGREAALAQERRLQGKGGTPDAMDPGDAEARYQTPPRRRLPPPLPI